jgi:hypothetical protein
MTFKKTKRDLLIELSRALVKDPSSKIHQERFSTIKNARNFDELNPPLSHTEYVRLIDYAYAAATVGGHMRITLENNRITNAEIAPPGTKGFSSPLSFLA